MVESVDFHALFTQLQTRYPGSGLISELVHAQADHYIVKASVQVGGTALASGLAAATTPEQAEDQARLRALRLVGIVPLGLVGNPVMAIPTYLPPLTSQSLGSAPSLEPVPAINASSALPEPITPPIAATVVDSFEGESLETSVLDLSDSLVEEEEPELVLAPLKASKPKSGRSNGSKASDRPSLESPEEEPEPYGEPDSFKVEDYEEEAGFSSEPIDLSELIALTDVEMERVGWSKKRGQTHLKQVYGRQTRAELDEEQLLEFLHYLRALPSNS